MSKAVDSDYPAQDPAARVKRFSKRALQLLVLLATIVVAVGVGASLAAEFLKADGVLIPFLGQILEIDVDTDGLLAAYAGTALGLTFFITVVKDAIKVAPSLLEYMSSPSLAGLGRVAALAFAAAFAITLVLPFLGGTRGGPAPMLVSVLPHRASAERDSLATFYVTWVEDATLDSLAAGEGPGVSLSQAYVTQLESLARGLDACGTVDAPVKVKVLGMASSSQLSGATDEGSRPLNRDLANLRAEVVAKELRDASTYIEVSIERWESYEHMIAARAFADRSGEGAYDTERATLTRRAEVHVVDAQECGLVVGADS